MKLKFGAIVVAGSGKIGGHVASKNRGGAYLRTKVTPSNPNTSAQALARSILTSLSVMWATLSDANRKSWNDAVGAFATTDIFGDLRNPSGLNLFVKLNANILQSGGTILEAVPAKVEIPFAPLHESVFDIGGSVFPVSFGTGLADGTIVRVQATAPMSAGISNFKSKLRNIGYLPLIGDSVDAYDAYVAKFGLPAAGSTIHWAASVVTETGQQGTSQSMTGVVIA